MKSYHLQLNDKRHVGVLRASSVPVFLARRLTPCPRPLMRNNGLGLFFSLHAAGERNL